MRRKGQKPTRSGLFVQLKEEGRWKKEKSRQRPSKEYQRRGCREGKKREGWKGKGQRKRRE